MLAGIPILNDATVVANVSVMDEEVDGLIVIMLCTGVVDVGQLVKGKLAIAFGGTEQAALPGERAAIQPDDTDAVDFRFQRPVVGREREIDL